MNNYHPSQETLRDYIQDKLSSEETEKLELWLIDHPEVLEDLELDLILKNGILPKYDNLENSSFQTATNTRALLKNKWLPLHVLVYGLAFLFLVNTFFIEKNDHVSSVFIELEKVRGASNIEEVQTIELDKNKNLVLRLFPDSLTKKYNLTLKSKASTQQIKFQDLIADDYGAITITLNNEDYLIGKWEIILDKDTNKVEQSFNLDIL